MNKLFRSHGKTYEIRQTGMKTKHVRAHTDFNGYDIEAETFRYETFGVFDGDSQVGKVHRDGAIIINGQKVGKL